ncbi:MAG: M28 family peptidase, partial [bacterium]|nr:M28 family peptidase [bacterium]
VDSRYYEDSYPYVTAVVPGEGAEEVLMLGHTSETGAQDNATGVAAMMEGAAALNRLIRAGRLPRPRRSIRMLAMGELYGSMHFIAENPERMRNTVAAFCLDTPAGFYNLAGTEYTFYLNPHVAKSYVDAFTMELAKLYFTHEEPIPSRPFHEKPYMMGTDTFLAEPMINVPTVWPYSGSGVHTHHNSADTPDDVDPRSLRDLTVVAASYLYYLASAGEDEAPWLAELALARGYRQILSAVDDYAGKASVAKNEKALGRLLCDGLEKLDYMTGREIQSLKSVQRLAANFDPSPMVRDLETFREQQAARLRRAAKGVKPAPPPPNPKLAGAEDMVVQRKRIGTITFDDLEVEDWEGWPSAASRMVAVKSHLTNGG